MKIGKGLAVDLLELFKIGQSTTGWETDWFGNNPILNFELVHQELVDTSRWSHIYERVYKDLDTGKFWHTSYSTGATECQDEPPYEYEGDEVEFVEVVPVEHTVVKYEVVK